MGARKNITYSQNFPSLETQWAQIFAPHNDGILPEHLQLLEMNKAWTWIFPFPQHNKISHYIFSSICLTDTSFWYFISVSYVSIIALMFSNLPLLQLIRWVSPNLFPFFFQPPVIFQLSSTPLNHSSPFFHLILFSPQRLSCKMF